MPLRHTQIRQRRRAPNDFRYVSGELVKRQEYEVVTCKRAVERLSERLNKQTSKDKLKEACTFWLISNAQLASMGIFPIPIPEILRDYQEPLNLGDQR